MYDELLRRLAIAHRILITETDDSSGTRFYTHIIAFNEACLCGCADNLQAMQRDNILQVLEAMFKICLDRDYNPELIRSCVEIFQAVGVYVPVNENQFCTGE